MSRNAQVGPSGEVYVVYDSINGDLQNYGIRIGNRIKHPSALDITLVLRKWPKRPISLKRSNVASKKLSEVYFHEAGTF